MNTPIETQSATTAGTTTPETNNDDKRDPGCCTVPPDGDPGPVKG